MSNKVLPEQAEIAGRKKAVLKAVVDTYVEEAVPVSSKKIAEKSFKEFSSATIRNDLAHLEESGFLFHTHVSSGRIPTDKGYRFFVDNFVDDTRSDSKIKPSSSFFETNDESVLEKTVQLVSSHTKLTAIALQTISKSRTISDLHLSKLSDSRYVLGIFFDDASLDRVVFSSADIAERTNWKFKSSILDNKIDEFISRFVIAARGLDIAKMTVNDFEKSRIYIESSDISMTEFFVNILNTGVSEKTGEANIFLSGTSAIAQNTASLNNFQDSEISSHLLALVEQHMELASVVQQSLQSKISAKIGSENIVEEMAHHSMVLAPINISDTSSGAIGVIGPTRMDYQNIFGLLTYASELIGSKLENMEK